MFTKSCISTAFRLLSKLLSCHSDPKSKLLHKTDFVEIGAIQNIITLYPLSSVFLIMPIPGAPAHVRVSKPPVYSAITVPNPVLHTISAQCAICAACSAVNPAFKDLLRAYERLRAAAPLEPAQSQWGSGCH